VTHLAAGAKRVMAPFAASGWRVVAMRIVVSRSIGGASGGRISSFMSDRLSSSAHCMSSIIVTSGERAARRVKVPRSAPKSRARRKLFPTPDSP
jgi:hypothetical protein